MDKNTENAVNDLFAASEQINNVFAAAYTIGINNRVPFALMQDFSENVTELHNCIFRIANHIALPNSEDFAPLINEKRDDAWQVIADKVCDYIRQLPTTDFNNPFKSVCESEPTTPYLPTTN